MNKKLLLILSILMSLSLLTMSCAKSVAAPDIIEGTAGLEELTDAQLRTTLQKIPTITDSTSGVTFNFSQGSGYPSSGYYSFNVTSSGAFANANQANILNELKRVLNEYQGDVIFTPAQNWDSTGSYSSAILTVNVTSSSYNVPSNFKTVKIDLYLMGGSWQ
ncbi:hypothetical protein [Brachyspira sp. G79]|uniref:hypothetical protein n=1 Tax=Brachyspira sp. G79 TaxID=1358104 RepID=UPI000BBCACC3|nr:hypothetical protein [Brachyspira sp. G79]PCG21130.1 hypothetical protein KQ44_01665 [Brachyspira sp. G79]